MHKLILIPFIVFGFIFTEGIFREEIYKLVGESGTINFSDSPTLPVNGAAKQDGGEVLNRNEMANLPGQGIYKSVDEKGTVNFSDNPTSPVIARKKGAPKQDGAAVLQRNEMANLPGQEVYRSVDEKGTINFSDSPASPVITTKRMSAKQEREEILKRNETANRPMTDSEIKAVLLTMPTWRGSASSPGWGSSGTAKRRKS
jgi:hypothetical protein